MIVTNICLSPVFFVTNTSLRYSNTSFPNPFVPSLTLTLLFLLFLSFLIPIVFLALVIYSPVFFRLIVSIHFRPDIYYFVYNYKTTEMSQNIAICNIDRFNNNIDLLNIGLMHQE
jgi:hypothetical protein